jgi:peptidoglycan/LPS O-acetylase OafA/YrhL
MTERNSSLDALRAAAVIMVVVHHAQMVMPLPQSWSSALRMGERGVDLFFVLSGYLVGGIALREFKARGGIDLLRFWRQRWFRTLPAYYVTLALYAAKELVPHRSAGLDPVVAYLGFVQVYVIGPLNDFAHSWSLCVEEHFYLALPLFLALCARSPMLRGPKVLALLAVVGLSLLLVREFVYPNPYQHLSHWRTDGLLLGVLLAGAETWFGARAWLTARIAWLRLLAVLATAAWVGRETFHGPGWQTVAALASLAWVALGVTRDGWLDALGRRPIVAWTSRISYSLYLLHPLVGGGLDFLWYSRTDRDPVLSSLYALSMMGLSFAAAHASYHLVEAPALRLRDRLAMRPQRTVRTETAGSSGASGSDASSS